MAGKKKVDAADVALAPTSGKNAKVIAVAAPAPKRRQKRLLKIFDVTNGTLQVTDVDTDEIVVIALPQLPMEVKVAAALHGISRVLDAAKEPLATAERIAAGNWPAGAVKAVRRPPIICEAIAKVRNMPLEQVSTIWRNLNAEQRKIVQGDFYVQAALKTLRAERLNKESSVAALFGVAPPGVPTTPPAAPPLSSAVAEPLASARPEDYGMPPPFMLE